MITRGVRLAFMTAVLVMMLSPARAVAGSAGVVVEEVFAGFGGAQAGLQPGDVLVGWLRAAAPPANPAGAEGELSLPWHFLAVELEQAQRGPLTVLGHRDGAPLAVRMPQQDWVVSVRPPLNDAALERYRQARELVGTDGYERAFAGWRELAVSFENEDRRELASWLWLKLARLSAWRAMWPGADEAYRKALAAADGDPIAQALIHAFAADSQVDRVDWAAAITGYQAALEICRARGAGSLQEAAVLDRLASVAFKHGDLQAAEQHNRHALDIREAAAPGSAVVANSIHNLGLVAAARGDLGAAEDYLGRALSLSETVAHDAVSVSFGLHNLGSVSERRGDLKAAAAYYTRALEYWRRNLPESLGTASGLVSLGNVSLKMGRIAEARDAVPRALEMAERIAPGGIISGDAALGLGDIAVAAADLDTAEAWYRRALQIRQAHLPGSAAEAEAHQRLAALQRQRQRPADALPGYLAALDILDRQRRALGGTDEVKARFGAGYASYYHGTVELLMELRRPEQAFHVLERYRARAFLALLAERDLVFSADVPGELDRERRLLRAEHDRAFAALAAATGAEAEEARRALDGLRRRQAEIEAREREASPRLAGLQYPEPLDLGATRAALDAGTLLLSYSIGNDQAHLFAVGPGPDDFAALKLGITPATLRDDVRRWRELLQTRSGLGSKRLRVLSERLSAALLGPVADRITRAERVLIVPDGPLHLVPFAALADPLSPRADDRHLMDARPVHVAASATVFAGIRTARPGPRPVRLVALGDPDYGATQPGAAPLVHWLRRRGLELVPLPGSRREVEELRRLYPEASRVHVGAEATEERACLPGSGATLVHFACHALADEASPLDSSLVLSLPRDWKPGQPNGLLQAWEILEQVRIDADLVTLSACGTALGEELSGEGILGLTRAFQYAGARTVLASLWAVNDESTAELMRRFYERLRRGDTKDAALRHAQREMRRAGRSHPALWAAFQLSGDWR